VSENGRLDEELAALTDRLLAGQEMEMSTEHHDLEQIVRWLRQVIAPKEQPDPAYRSQLAQRLIREWNLTHQRQPHGWKNRQVIRLAALGAILTLVVVGLVLWSAYNGVDNDTLQGTALGSLEGGILVGAAVIGVVIVLFWYRRHRDR
jgi:hypothetical protein